MFMISVQIVLERGVGWMDRHSLPVRLTEVIDLGTPN